MISKNLAIMFTDIQGFTERTAHQTRAENEEMLRLHKEQLLPFVQKHEGRIVKSIGDAFLIVFESCTNALLAGIDIQKCLADSNCKLSEPERINISISISAGDVRLAENDVFGEAVNVAARLEEITPANEIHFTDSVFYSMNRREIPFVEMDEAALPGVPYKVKLYKVMQEKKEEAPPAKSQPTSSGDEDARRFLEGLQSMPLERISVSGLLQEVMGEFLPQVEGKHIKVQLVPPPAILPEISGLEGPLRIALLSILRYALTSVIPKKGQLQVKFVPSCFRSADVAFATSLQVELLDRYPYLEADQVTALRGDPAVKIELQVVDGFRYRTNKDFYELWEKRRVEKANDLNAGFHLVFKAVQACGGTIIFQYPTPGLLLFKIKLPAA